MESLITVGFRHCDPVADTFGMRPIEIGKRGIYAVTHLLLPYSCRRIEDDTHGIEVVDLLKRNTLSLHLTPYGVHRLDACLSLVGEPHGGKTLTNRCREIVIDHLALLFASFYKRCYTSILGRMLELEAQVLQFGLYAEQPQAMGKRGIYIEGLACDLVLLVGSH